MVIRRIGIIHRAARRAVVGPKAELRTILAFLRRRLMAGELLPHRVPDSHTPRPRIPVVAPGRLRTLDPGAAGRGKCSEASVR